MRDATRAPRKRDSSESWRQPAGSWSSAAAARPSGGTLKAAVCTTVRRDNDGEGGAEPEDLREGAGRPSVRPIVDAWAEPCT